MICSVCKEHGYAASEHGTAIHAFTSAIIEKARTKAASIIEGIEGPCWMIPQERRVTGESERKQKGEVHHLDSKVAPVSTKEKLTSSAACLTPSSDNSRDPSPGRNGFPFS